jgi:hypothetical protein
MSRDIGRLHREIIHILDDAKRFFAYPRLTRGTPAIPWNAELNPYLVNLRCASKTFRRMAGR